ncbi:hypothetical protein H9Q71_002922 [Fusarium xylarioides]|nr:hypothetical protein H9Q71_002922 [Fusarium xylarioides]
MQESIANREILTISLLQSAGIIGSREELQRRIATAQPPHTRPSGSVRILLDKFHLLSASYRLTVPLCEEHKFDSLPRSFPFTVISRFLISDPAAPRCSVVHSGGMPVFDGQEGLQPST